MRRLMSLWGSGAKAEEGPKEETEDEKAAREQAEKEAADKKAKEAEEAAAAFDEDDEEEDEEEDEATKAAASAVPAKVRASIVRAERTRIHAIVVGGGASRVETSLKLALGTNLSAKAALEVVRTTAGASAEPPSGGRLGLQREMAGRTRQPLGPDTAPGGAQTDVDKAAAGILKHVSKAP